MTDLVRSSTGYNAGGLVRRVGGKRLLLLGGAAVAGGLIADAARRQPGSEPASREAPLPPLPKAAAPPLPPVPRPEIEADELSEEVSEGELPPASLYALVRTMVAAALADGELAGQEKRLIEKHLEESGLEADQVAQIRRELILPATPKELAEALPAGEDPELLVRFATLVMLAHEEVTEHEAAWLEQLGDALGVDAGRRDAIRREIFPGEAP